MALDSYDRLIFSRMYYRFCELSWLIRSREYCNVDYEMIILLRDPSRIDRHIIKCKFVEREEIVLILKMLGRRWSLKLISFLVFPLHWYFVCIRKGRRFPFPFCSAKLQRKIPILEFIRIMMTFRSNESRSGGSEGIRYFYKIQVESHSFIFPPTAKSRTNLM